MAGKRVELVFPSKHLKEKYPSAIEEIFGHNKQTEGSKILDEFVTTLDDIADWFSKFHVESIELSLSGAIGTGDAIKLFVSAEGEAGIKITLQPNKP